MPLILAIEPDRRQASELTAIVRGQLHAELVLGESAERALAALGQRVPDLILTSALLSPKDEAVLGERLRALDGSAVHVQTLTIPVLASSSGRGDGRPGSVLFGLRREKTKASMSDGCDPDVFAEQCRQYLDHSATERALMSERAVSTPQEAPTVVIPKQAEPARSEERVVKPWVEALAEPQETVGNTRVEPPAETEVTVPSNPVVLPEGAFSEHVAQKAHTPRARRSALPWAGDNTDGPASLLAAVAALEAEEHVPVEPVIAETSGAAEASFTQPSEPEETPASTNSFVASPRRANPFHGIPSGENPFDNKPSDVRPMGKGHSDALGSEWAEGGEIDLSSLLDDSSPRTRRTNRSTNLEDDRTGLYENDDRAGAYEKPDRTAASEKADRTDASEKADRTGAYEIDRSLHPAAVDSVLLSTAVTPEKPSPASAAELARTAPTTPPQPTQEPAQTETAAKAELAAMKEWADILEALRRDAEQAASHAAPGGRASSAGTKPADVPSEDGGVQNAATTEGPSASEASHADGDQRKKKRAKGGQAHDEWGFFDPDEYGFSALIEKLEEITDKDETPTPKSKPKRA
jgi:hypothetical protein